MTSTPKANIKAIVKLANGQQIYTLEALSQLKLTAGAKITLVDQVSGKAVTGLLAKRKGKDLVLELEGQGEVASLVDFYSSPNVAFYPSGEIPASAMASSTGAVTAETTTAAVTAAGEPVVWKAPAEFGSMGWLAADGEPVVWKAPAEFGSMGWLAAGGVGLAAAGGGAATAAVVVVKPAVLVGNFVMGPVLEGSGLVATVYDAAGKVLGVATIQNDGLFTLALQQPYTGAVLVVVTDENGTAPDYWDEATGAPKGLTVVLRAMAYINNGQVVNVNVNVFTEAAVREISDSGSTTLPQGVTAEQIAVANDKVKNALGLVDDLVTGAAPVAVVTNTGASNLTANDYGKLLAAASGVDEAGSTEATIQSLRLAVAADNPVLSTSILLLAGATNVADKVPSFLTESQMGLSDYFFIADAINGLRTELTGALSLGDLRSIKALSDQLNTLSGALTDLGGATGVEITELQAALGVPNTATLGDPSNATGLYKTIADAVSSAVLSLQGQIDNQASLLNDAIALGDKTNADAIAKLVNDAVQGGEPTTGSIAGLKAALTALSGVVDNNNGAQSLALTNAQDALNKAITAVTDDLQGKINALASRIDTNVSSTALILDDTSAVGNTTGNPTTNSIAGLKAALDLLSSAANADLKGLTDRITALEAGLDTAAPAITNIAITATNQDAAGAYGDGDAVRVEVSFDEAVLVKGAPTFALEVGANTVQAAYVSGAGTDKLVFRYTLNARRDSTDADGISAPANALTLNTGDAVTDAAGNLAVIMSKAIADSLALVVDNGPLVLSFTAGDIFGWDADAGETIAKTFLDLIQGRNAANVLLEVTTPLTVAQAAALVEAGFDLTNNVTYALRDYDTTVSAAMLVPGTATVVRGATQVTAIGDELDNAMRFTSFDQRVNLRVEAGAGKDTIDAGRGNDTIVGQAGGDTINLTSADNSFDTVVYQTVNDGQSLPVSTVTFSTNPQDYRPGSVLTVTINGKEYSHTVSTKKGDVLDASTVKAELDAFAAKISVDDLLVYSSNVLTAVNTDTGTLRFFGKTGQKLTVQAGGDVEAAIDNNGQVTVVTVDFSSAVADWPTATNGTNTTQFTRKLSVTIDGKTISADLVFDQDGKPNPALSVAALRTAIETANTVGDIKGLLASVNGVTIKGTQLTLTGATAPVTDTAAPTFKVDAASVDTNGVQQASRVAFSTNDADYYQGGKLSVVIAGVDVIADMVAGSATDSVESLLQAIKNKVELAKVLEGVVRDKASLTLTAATEKADPLMLNATQDYQGEQQQATLQLETGGPDGAYDQYSDGMYTDRGADVYYQGGKAYVNIRGAGSDGLMGTGDDVSVTVDALMGKDAITTSQNLVDAINAKVMGSPVDTPAVFTVAVTGLNERFDISQSVFVSGSIQIGTGTTKYFGATVTTVEGLYGVFAEVLGLASVKLNDAGDRLTFSTVATGASAEMKAYIEISSSDGVSRTYYARSSPGLPETVKGKVATLSNPDPVLSQVLQGAELKDGIITLTAKQYGKETFVISDVTLDYQGVKQLASIKLDSSSIPYGSTFIDGKTSDDASYGRGANVYYDGGKAYVTIRGAGVDGLMRTGDDVSVTVEALMGLDAIATRQNLVDAINIKIKGNTNISSSSGSAAVAPDMMLSQLLQGAELMQDGSIVLTAKNAGRETFTVSDVTLDYQGQTQQAKATYSTTNADYYAGGTLSLTVDTTPDLSDGTAGDVTVTANMVAGSAVDSLSALKAAIDAELQVQQGKEATPTVITVDLTGALTSETVNTPPGYLVPTFLVSQWGLFISDGLSTVFSQGSLGSFSGPVWGGENTTFQNFGAFVTYLDGLGEASNAFDAAIESGNLVITSRAKGADVDMRFILFVGKVGADFPNPDTLFYKAINNNSQTGYTDGSEAVIGSNGRLATVLSEVSVDANGAITLTSKEKTEHAFDISKAEISYPGVKQVSEIVFDGLNDDNFYTTDDAGNQGTVSISIAGTKVTANMGDTKAATLQSLAARIEALRDGVGAVKDDNIAAAVGTVAVIDDKLVLTAAAAGIDPLGIDLGSFSITTPEVHGDFHKMTIQFSNSLLDSAAMLGETLSITLKGLTTQLTVDQALLNDAGNDQSVYLVGKLLDKVIADHTQAVTTSLDLAAAATAQLGNLLSFQASKRGVGLLDVATASVTINDGAGTSPIAALLEVVAPGVNDTPASTSSQGITLNDATGEGKAVTGVNADPVAQTITNPGIDPADNSDLSGDSPLTGTAGLQQDFVNPGFGLDALNSTNPGFFGDDPSSQAGEAFALGGAFSQGNAIEVTMFREAQWNAASANPNYAFLSILLTFSDGGQSYAFDGFVQSNDARLEGVPVDPALGFLPGDNFATAVSKMNDVLSLLETRVGRELGSITYDALTRKVTMTAVEGVTVSPGTNSNPFNFFDPLYVTFPNEFVSLLADGSVQGALQPGESFDASIIVKSLDGGVGQTFTNPGYGFNAQPDSPVKYFGNPNPGNGDLYGSDPGKYTDTGLNTTSLNGGTVTGTASGNTQIYGYGEPNNPIDRIDLGNGSISTDGGTAGKDAGSLTNSTSEADAFVVKTDTTGFAPFESRDSVLMVRSTGGAVADVVNNFQTAHDFVALEGELLASTVEGDVNGVKGFVTPTPVTLKVFSEIVDTVNDFPKEVSFAWNLPSADIPFSVITDQDDSRFSMFSPTNFSGFIPYVLPNGLNQFDNLADFVSVFNSYGGLGAPAFDVRLGDDGKVYMSAPDGYAIGGNGVFNPEVSFLSSEGVAFDLSTTEFGLVDSADSTIDTAALGFSTEVADVLNSLFDFDAVLGGTTDNSEINTTVFAVTAADNPNVTAIWAHTQSSTGDSTLEAYELNLLATVNTLGQEFQLFNFMPEPFPVIIA